MCLRGNVLTSKEESKPGGGMSDCFPELFPSFGGNGTAVIWMMSTNKQINLFLDPDTTEDIRDWCFSKDLGILGSDP